MPLAYRRNYFFADFNSGRFERVTLGADNSVTSVDHFATSIAGAIDAAVGPDGALYFARYSGALHRVSFNATAQGLIVTPLQLRIDESGRGVVNVRLAQAPAANVSVNAVNSGGADVSILSGSTLTFTPSNWFVPQTVSLQAAQDADGSDDVATLSVSSTGLTTEAVGVAVTDNLGTPVAAAVPATSAKHLFLYALALLGAALCALVGRSRLPTAQASS